MTQGKLRVKMKSILCLNVTNISLISLQNDDYIYDLEQPASRPISPHDLSNIPEPFGAPPDHRPEDHNNQLDEANEPDARGVPEVAFIPQVADLQTSLEFINALKAAKLNDEGLDEEILQRLRQPLTEPADASDPDFRLSLDLFLSTSNSSEETYNNSRAAVLRRHPDDNILSYA
jgi:hypothetical protein